MIFFDKKRLVSCCSGLELANNGTCTHGGGVHEIDGGDTSTGREKKEAK